jgi:hypothetical protein
MRTWLFVAAAFSMWMIDTGSAAAQTGYTGFLSVGPEFSIAFCCDEETTYGVGGEVSYSRVDRDSWAYAGGFFDWMLFFPGSRGYHRLSAGAQAGWTAFGAAGGVAWQSASPVTESSWGVQFTPYLSGAFVWTGFRFTLPGACGAKGDRPGSRVEWLISLKLPIGVDGYLPSGGGGDSDSDWDW